MANGNGGTTAHDSSVAELDGALISCSGEANNGEAISKVCTFAGVRARGGVSCLRRCHVKVLRTSKIVRHDGHSGVVSDHSEMHS